MLSAQNPPRLYRVELTNRERELILKHSFAPDILTRKLRIVPPPGASSVVRYSLEDLDCLAGSIAAESNHAKTRKRHEEWRRIFLKIDAILQAYTDSE